MFLPPNQGYPHSGGSGDSNTDRSNRSTTGTCTCYLLYLKCLLQITAHALCYLCTGRQVSHNEKYVRKILEKAWLFELPL